MNIQTGLEGRYRFEAFRTDESGNEIPGSRRVAADWFNNLITDAGLHALCESQTLKALKKCLVGSGSKVPAESDVALEAKMAEVDDSSGSLSVDFGLNNELPHYGWLRYRFRFNAGKATGNLSEVGIAFGNNTLFSRALIRGSDGEPAAISVLADETLDVFYEIRLYVPTQDVTSQLDIGGTQTAVTIRAAAVAAGTFEGLSSIPWVNYHAYWARHGVIKSSHSVTVLVTPNPIVDIKNIPNLTSATRHSVASDAPVYAHSTNLKSVPLPYANDFVARGQLSLWLSQANLTDGIKSIVVNTIAGVYQIGFDPPVQKTADKIFSLDLALAIGRHSP